MVRTNGCEAENYYIAIRDGKKKLYQTLTGKQLDIAEDPASNNVGNASGQDEDHCTDLKFVKDCAGNPTGTLRFHELEVGPNSHQVGRNFEENVIKKSTKYVKSDTFKYPELEASLKEHDLESSAKLTNTCSKGGKKSRRKTRRSKKSHRKSSKKQRKSRRGGKSRRGRR